MTADRRLGLTQCFGLVSCCLALALAPADARGEDAPTLPGKKRSIDALRESIQKAAELPGAAPILNPQAEAAVVLWIEKAYVGTNNAYTAEGIRYAQILVKVGNGTDQTLTLRRDDVSLQAGKQTLTIGRQRGFVPLPFDPNHPARPFPGMPPTLTIGPGEAVTTGFEFIGLDPATSVPPMTLRLQFDEGPQVELDLNAQLNARLGLSSRRIGPHRAIGVVTIRGELNTVNAASLAGTLNELHAAGVQRAIIEWAENAPPADDRGPSLLSWLLLSTTGRQSQLYQQLPQLPVMRQIMAAQIPEQNLQALEWDEINHRAAPNLNAAATKIFAEILPRIRRDELMSELRQGDPVSQQAILRLSARQLGAEILPLLLNWTNNTGSPLREAAIIALGAQPDEEAARRVQTLLQGSQAADAEAALTGMLQSDTVEARGRVLQALEQESVRLPRETIVRLLAENYHPDWNSYLVRCTGDRQASVRRVALLALQQLGHPQLSFLSIAALRDPEREVRETAFQILVHRPHDPDQEASLNYALDRLKAGEVSDSVLSLIERLREGRAAPLLLAQMSQPHPRRMRMIEVLGLVGSDDDLRQLLDQMDTLNPDEQAAAIRLSQRLSRDLQLSIARKAVESREPTVRQAALVLLKQIRNAEALQILERFSEGTDQRELSQLCDALGEMGTPASLQLLHRLRQRADDQKDSERVEACRKGILIWMSRSPGWTYVQISHHHTEAKEWKKSVSAATLAIEIDPSLTTALTLRGNAHLHMKEYEQAGADFAKAIELDPDDSDALTGIAIVWAITGNWQKGVELVDRQNDRHGDNKFFLYNTACVYGRSIEYLQKQPQTAERDRQVSRLQTQAIDKLNAAIRKGFDDFKLMKEDPDLASLRELAGFKKLFRQEL